MTIIGQQGATRFLVDAGKDDDLRLGRVYDLAEDSLSDAMPVDSITGHSPGWTEPTASRELLENVSERVAALA